MCSLTARLGPTGFRGGRKQARAGFHRPRMGEQQELPSKWLDWQNSADCPGQRDIFAVKQRSRQFKRKCVLIDIHRRGETCEAWVKRNFANSRLHTRVLIAEAISNNTRLWKEQGRYGIARPTSDPEWFTCYREPLYRSEALFVALSARVLRLAFKARAYYWSGVWLRKIWSLQRDDGSFQNRDESTEPDDENYVADHHDEGRIDAEYDNAWLYDVD